jgi:hypothetical protein
MKPKNRDRRRPATAQRAGRTISGKKIWPSDKENKKTNPPPCRERVRCGLYGFMDNGQNTVKPIGIIAFFRRASILAPKR